MANDDASTMVSAEQAKGRAFAIKQAVAALAIGVEESPEVILAVEHRATGSTELVSPG